MLTPDTPSMLILIPSLLIKAHTVQEPNHDLRSLCSLSRVIHTPVSPPRLTLIPSITGHSYSRPLIAVHTPQVPHHDPRSLQYLHHGAHSFQPLHLASQYTQVPSSRPPLFMTPTTAHIYCCTFITTPVTPQQLIRIVIILITAHTL